MRSWLVAAALLVACGGNDDGKSAPAPAPRATPVTTAADPIERTADQELAAIDGLRPGAVPARSLQALDGVAPFGATEPAPECATYGKSVAQWFATFQTEYEQLEDNFSPDARGAEAMRKFAAFLRRGVSELQEIRVDGEQLARAHTQFVAALRDLATGFEQLAKGIDDTDEAAITEAAQRVENAVGNFRIALDELVSLCGE